jgi:hypothetical protein
MPEATRSEEAKQQKKYVKCKKERAGRGSGSSARRLPRASPPDSCSCLPVVLFAGQESIFSAADGKSDEFKSQAARIGSLLDHAPLITHSLTHSLIHH